MVKPKMIDIYDYLFGEYSILDMLANALGYYDLLRPFAREQQKDKQEPSKLENYVQKEYQK